jgi:farnesyl-diphosphate farnesyltransferase
MSASFSQSRDGTVVLKGVSRSFYLSLRLLPQSMRDAAGLAYLLARGSDTIADTAAVPVTDRLASLDAYHRAIMHGEPFAATTDILEHCSANEKILLENSAAHLRWLDALSPSLSTLIREVLEEIISGQRLDLVRFGHASATERMILGNDDELLDYCQRVAGSVGAFWTELGFLGKEHRFSRESRETMLTWGRHFGCGLQLVNILRDRPEDMRNGRYYLPDTADMPPGEPALRAHDRWLDIAKDFVHEGMRYADALHGRRLRCATVLPALLALETIEKLDSATWQELEQRVKVSKATVFRCLAEAMLF